MNPDALPDDTEKVSLVQTHISIVLVADEFVYKIKKPVDFGFLDFSTLEKRHYFCLQEINLNRRLSKDLYLGVLPVLFDEGTHSIGEGRGEVVDYAVKMKRIPDEMLMKSLFERGELKTEHLKEVARVLAGFHLTANRSPEIDEFGKPDMFRINTDENFEQTERYIGATIERKDYNALNQWTDGFYHENKDSFHERIRSEKIRDCHGDLHMEHVCLADPISIFDCIEFNDRFRYTDTLADIAFLLMDLEYRGRKDLADMLWGFYTEIAGDSNMDSLLTFYKVYRAYVRGKVNSFQIDDDQIARDKKKEAVQTAREYFRLARRYIE
ncbi:MAG: gluconokinase [Deltaproteobacteria bacterium]|nr:gluconokinase [Deltaproteobacteria bacterium]